MAAMLSVALAMTSWLALGFLARLALGLLLACSWLALGSCARLALCLALGLLCVLAYKSRRYFHGPPSSSYAMPVLSRFPPNTQAYVHPRILSCVGPAVAMLALWEFSFEVVSSALSMLIQILFSKTKREANKTQCVTLCTPCTPCTPAHAHTTIASTSNTT